MEGIALIGWQIIGVILAADFITGLMHFLEDSYLTPKPGSLLSKLVVEPNLEHHADPTLFTRMGDAVSRNIYQFAAFGVIVGIAQLVVYYVYGTVLPWWVFVMGIAASIGNETHCWAHSRNNNKLITLLQDMCIVITPRNHNKHHRQGWDAGYCVITNLLNPILDGLKFWRALEWLIGLFGPKPKRGSAERRFL